MKAAAVLALSSLALAACDVPVIEIVYCEQMDYAETLSGGADRIEVWPGTPEGYGTGPLASIDSPDRVTRTARFFLERAERWYVPASYSTDPEMIDHWGHYSIRFFRGDAELSAIRMTGVQMITEGCDAQTVKVLSPKDTAILHNLLYETPIQGDQ